MAIRRIILLALSFLLMTGRVSSQSGNINYTVQTLGGYTTPGLVPFWLRSNQFGSIPLDGASLSFIGSARRDYDLSKDKLFDWGASLEGRANLGKGSNLTLIEGYGKVHVGIFEFRAGRSKEIMGLCDTTLTSGSWAVSGTNLGIPKIEVSIPEFYAIPWFGELFSIKGNFSHGWLGDVPMRRWFEGSEIVQVNTYLHQKSFYGRLGKPLWKFKLYGGFNHQVLWGNEHDFYTHDFQLSPFSTYMYVLTGKRYNNGFIQATRLGNHLGSLDIGLEYRFDKVKLLLYRQTFYDGGALSSLANIQDGLNGISIENQQRIERPQIWQKLLIEFLYTKNQAGEPWSREYGSAYENYFNHGEYANGWSYLGIGLGNPFITSKNYIRDDLPAAPEEYFVNNRLLAVNFGCVGSMERLNYLLKISWSKNYGTYWTTDEEQSTDISNPGAYGIFGIQEQISTYLELNTNLDNGLNLGVIGAFDSGQLFNNSLGIFFKASYSIY